MSESKNSGKKWRKRWWIKLPVLLAGLFLLMHAILSVNPNVGIPNCDALNTKKSVIAVFNDIPIVKNSDMQALDIFDIEQLEYVENKRAVPQL